MLSQLVERSLHTGRDSLTNVQHFVESHAGRLIEKQSLRSVCESLVRQGRIDKVGPDVYQLADHPATYPPQPPTVLDVVRDVLSDTAAPLSITELTDHVSAVIGRSVSRWTIRTVLVELRSLGFPVRSHGRRPTAYILEQA
jgi:hypothetical protein